MSEKLNSAQNGQIGIVAALLEGIILQPTLYWKNARALNIPFTLNPRIIYRGTLASCLNECQLLGFQFSATGFFNKTLSERDSIKNVQVTELVSAAMAGIMSTLLTCPIELVMIQQQHCGGSFATTSLNVLKTYGAGASGSFRGLTPTIGRETICVVGMLGITPIVSFTIFDCYWFEYIIFIIMVDIFNLCRFKII